MKTVGLTVFCLVLAAGAMAVPDEAQNPMSGKSVAQLRQVLKSDVSEMDRVNAALALLDMVTPPGSRGGKKGRRSSDWELKILGGFVEACMAGLEDRSCAVRFYSSKAALPAGAEALPGLIKIAGSANGDARISAIHAIAMMAKSMAGKNKGEPGVDLTPVFGSALPVLRKALEDDNYIVRETACGAFSRLGVAGAPAIDDLIALLEDENFCVVNRAVHAVAAADPGGTKSVPALVKALESEYDVREFIVKELAGMDKAAKEAVPALCKLVGEDKNSWHVALESTKALLRIVTYEEEPEQDAMVVERGQALNALAEVLMNQDAQFLQARIRNTVLGNTGYCPVGPEADLLVQWLMKALREFAPVEPGYWGTPRPQICAMLARIGQNYKGDEIVALAKELRSAEDTHETALEDLDVILNLEKK